MAELHQVSINEQSEEEQITLEQENAMQEEAEAQKKEQQEPLQNDPDRPEWLDDKFKSPEDLAKAYAELEKKQGSPNNKSEETEETEEVSEEPSSPVNSVISKAQEQYAEKGELTDKMFKELEQAGIPSEFVQAYIAGQESISVSEATDVQDTIGGRQNYEAMTEWAQENLTETDIDAYDDVVTNGTIEQAKMAVQGMYARFLSGGGQAPNLTQGSTSGDSVKPFNSAAQVTEAMSDARYAKDPAYRATVEKRLQVSNVI
jgi:hypothetical protein